MHSLLHKKNNAIFGFTRPIFMKFLHFSDASRLQCFMLHKVETSYTLLTSFWSSIRTNVSIMIFAFQAWQLQKSYKSPMICDVMSICKHWFVLIKVCVNRKFATVFTSVLWHTSEKNRILNEENRGHGLFFYCELIGCSKVGLSFRNEHWQLEGRG